MNRSFRETIETVRAAALALHKVLMTAVQLEHERDHGRVGSAQELLHLVVNDHAFAWLRPLSALVVALDELLAMGEPTDTDAAAVRVEVEDLLSRSAERFQTRYLVVLQTVPEAVLAHATLQRAIAALPKSPPEDIPALLAVRQRWRAPRRRAPKLDQAD